MQGIKTPGQAEKLREYLANDFSLALCDYPTGMRQGWHEHEQFVIAMTLHGHVREQVGTSDQLIEPYRIGIKPSGVRHTDHFSDKGVRVLRLAVSADLESALREFGDLRNVWSWESDPAYCRPMLRLARRLLLEQPGDTAAIEEVYEAVAALRQRDQKRPDPPGWLELARKHLEATFADGTRLSHLAAAAKVHPAYFARRFAEFYGCSVGTYVRRLQLRLTTELMATRKYELADIAVAVGFSDQAHLTRTFLAEFGLTPGKLRKFLE